MKQNILGRSECFKIQGKSLIKSLNIHPCIVESLFKTPTQYQENFNETRSHSSSFLLFYNHKFRQQSVLSKYEISSVVEQELKHKVVCWVNVKVIKKKLFWNKLQKFLNEQLSSVDNKKLIAEICFFLIELIWRIYLNSIWNIISRL